MKSEELLNSLDYIGSDLLAEAEQNVLVRAHRPWLKNAVAAALAVAVGVGGFLALNKYASNTKNNPADTGNNPNVITEPVNTENLAKITLGDSWNWLPSQLYQISDNCPSLCDPAITSLPVYNSRVAVSHAFLEYNMRTFYSETELRAMLNDRANLAGIQFDGEPSALRNEDGVYEVTKNVSGLGSLSVYGDGEFCAYCYAMEGFSSDTNEDLENVEGAEMKEHLSALPAQFQQELGLPQYENILFDDYGRIAYFFPTLDDPTQQLLARSFAAYRAYLPNYTSVCEVNWYQRPDDANLAGTNQEWLVLDGWYPIITLDEAKASIKEGHFFSNDDFIGTLTDSDLEKVQLVYPEVNLHHEMIPYYQFILSGNKYVCVPAVRPEYLTDWPADYYAQQEAPVYTEPVNIEPTDVTWYEDPTSYETEPAMTEEEIEQTLSAWESELNGEYYSRYELNVGNYNYVNYFSDGHTRIWLENDEVLKKDLATGKVETVCTLEHNDEIKTTLQGVTENRLYFGWNEVEDWWGVNVYSVDYHNENRIDWADAQEVYCGGGWIRMETFRSDVRGFALRVIDRNDQLVVNEEAKQTCWGDAVVDGNLYYVVDQFMKRYYSLSEEERNAISQEAFEGNRQFDLCRVSPDGSITTVGSIEAGAYAYFWINAEQRELICEGSINVADVPEELLDHIYVSYYDLDTLAVKRAPMLLRDMPVDRLDTSREVGVGINILKNDAEAVIFYNYFGLFGFDGTTGDALFYLDFDEVFDRQGFTQIQGSGGGTYCGFNSSENKIVLLFKDEARGVSECLLIDLNDGVCYDPTCGWMEPEQLLMDCDSESVMSPYGGETMAELWIAHNGDKWYPFQNK